MPKELQNQLATQHAIYDVLWKHFDGRHWNATQPSRKVPKWPLRINLVQASCFVHTATWAGDMPDTSEPVTKPHLEPRGTTQAAKKRAEYATEVINQVWHENNGRALLMGANTVAQAVGGVVLKLRWDTYKGWRRTTPIKIETVMPDYFVGIPDGTDFYDLLEAWIVREMPLNEAEVKYGYKRTKRDSDSVQYVEHWTRNSWRITINDRVANFRGRSMSGYNDWGFVPMVYFPHIRHAGAFAGIPLFAQLLSLVEEYNGRMTNEGDLYIKAIHDPPWMANVRNKLKIETVGNQRFLNLGTGSAASGSPEIGNINMPNVGKSLSDYNDRLFGLIKQLSFTPEVAWGVDSGSQRSGESRDRLLLPLTQHIGMEREAWSPGLCVLDEMILRMLGQHGLEKITEAHYNHRMSQIWHPMFPADRAKLIEEMTARMQASLVSPEHALRQFGDVEDIPAELDAIKKYREWSTELGKPDPSAVVRPSKDKLEQKETKKPEKKTDGKTKN